MASVNNITALPASANVGLSSIQFDPKEIRGAFIVPKGFIINNAQLATLLTTLQAATSTNAKLARIYPVAGFVDFKDNSEKSVNQTFGYGAEVNVRDGIYKWAFQFTKGGKPLNDALRVFNGQNWDFFFVDSKNVLFGTKYVDAAGLVGIKALPSIDLYTQPFGWNDGKKLAEYIIEFKLAAKYCNELGSFIDDAPFTILDSILGLQDVVLTGIADAVAGSYDVSALTNYGINLGDIYGGVTGLAQIGAWAASNPLTGLPIPVLTAVYNGAAFVISVDKTSLNYPAAGKININLIAPTALNVLGIMGLESAGAASILKN